MIVGYSIFSPVLATCVQLADHNAVEASCLTFAPNTASSLLRVLHVCSGLAWTGPFRGPLHPPPLHKLGVHTPPCNLSSRPPLPQSVSTTEVCNRPQARGCPPPWSARRDWMSLSRTSCNNSRHYYSVSLLLSPAEAFFCLFFSIFTTHQGLSVDILPHHDAVACVSLFLFLFLFSQLTLSLFHSYQLAWLPTFFSGERFFTS
jgi:hypothetical protein